jgi:putative colanic acid biosynthesis UDP-glucose lipid carrier transferase
MKRSSLIISLSIIWHLAIINLVLYFLTPVTYLDYSSIGYYNLSWLLISYGLNFYPISRNEQFISNWNKLIYQYLIFGLSYFALFGFKDISSLSSEYQAYVLLIIFSAISFSRWVLFMVLKAYRIEGGNSVSVVIVGNDKNLEKMVNVFNKPELGYRYKGYFDNKRSESTSYLGLIEDSFQYIINNNIDEIYCMVSQLSSLEIKNLINFADNNFKRLKIIPDNKDVYTRAMGVELFGPIPVLNLRKSPLDSDLARIGKRGFDIIFSVLVIILVLSWLTPLVYILLNIESKGPVFFKQRRHGYNKKVFWCYKFRSMSPNKDADSSMCTKNDYRITKIGRILRKTSIDELPQFFNVFLGDMSVVGPRPHMQTHTHQYESSVDKYLVRHFVKPGITGLAQIKGYRGEIVKKADIINRVRMDVFYIEKWCLMMDVKIIYSTIYNAIQGEEKAY